MPSVERKDICKDMLVTAKGFASRIIVSAVNNELIESDLYFMIFPKCIIISIIPALITDFEKPVSAMKNKMNKIDSIADVRLYFLKYCVISPEMREVHNAR